MFKVYDNCITPRRVKEHTAVRDNYNLRNYKTDRPSPRLNIAQSRITLLEGINEAQGKSTGEHQAKSNSINFIAGLCRSC